MKKDWEIKKLGEVCVIGDGNHSSKYPKKSEMVDEGVPFIRSNNLIKGQLSWKNMRYISVEKHLDIKKGHLKTNDVLFTNRGQIGKLAIVSKDFNNSNLNSQIAWFRCSSILNNQFLYYFLSSPKMTSHYLVEKNGAALQQFTISKIKILEIPLPPLKEQQQIVAILDKAFTAIDQAKTNAQQNLLNAKELFESYLQNVFENKGDDWVEKTLGEVLQKTKTVNPKLNPKDEFIYLDVSSVNKETKLIEKATTLLGEDAPSRARKLVETDDIIFATVRPTHSRVAIITEEYNNQVCSTGYYVLKPKDYLNNHFVFYFILTYGFNKKMESMQKGASYPAVTNKEVESVFISFPKSIKEQQQIVKKLNSLSAETKKLEIIYQQKINDLEELKKSVLQKAFNGQLTVENG